MKLYTYEEVKAVLCEACKLQIPSAVQTSTTPGGDPWHYHTVNGERISCLANAWRNKANEEKQ